MCGRSTNTVAAKARGRATFIKWFVGEHGDGEIQRWAPRDTRRFVTALNDAGRQPTTINWALYTLKHFARWVHKQPGGVFAHFGLPVAEVEPYGVDEVDCKKLIAEQVAAVLAAVAKTSKRATKRKGQSRAAVWQVSRPLWGARHAGQAGAGDTPHGHAQGHKVVFMSLHPHQLRHTLGALYREASGSDTEFRGVRQRELERMAVLTKALEPADLT